MQSDASSDNEDDAPPSSFTSPRRPAPSSPPGGGGGTTPRPRPPPSDRSIGSHTTMTTSSSPRGDGGTGREDAGRGIPPTPAPSGGGRGDDDDDDDHRDAVPATPAARIRRRHDDDHNDDNDNNDVPGTPLTPLSTLDQDEASLPPAIDDHDDEEMEDSLPPPAVATVAAVLNDPLFPTHPGAPQQHIRGTDVNIPTAAAAFTDFLRNFKSLRHSQRQQQQQLQQRQPQSRRRRQQQQQQRRADDGNGSDDDINDDDDDAESVLSDASSIDDLPPLYLSKLQQLVTTTGGGTTAKSLAIDTMHIYYHSPACQRFYRQLVAYPMELVPLMDILVQRELERLSNNDHAPQIQVRPYNLKSVSNLRCLDPVDMDSLVSVKGMIVRCSPIIPDLKVAHFSCVICGHIVHAAIDRGRISEPTRCPQCTTTGSYQIVHNRGTYADKQLVRLQETPDRVPAGQTPASVTTFCFDDLVDSVQPGDKVEVTGVLRAQPVRVHPRVSKVKSVYKTYVDVIHFRTISGMESDRDKRDLAAQSDVRVVSAGSGHGTGTGNTQRRKRHFPPARVAQLQALSRDPDIYQKLTDSLAPSIWELDNVKRGVLCMLFGGNNKRVKPRQNQEQSNSHDDNDWDDEDDQDDDEGKGDRTTSMHKRSDINILLCGDPGTSKSQLLTYVNKLSHRGIYTSGKGSSAVGLTASVVRDPETRDLVLESGALVLANEGICAIDEFDKMSDATRSVLHEAMEQQTVSIAKAGIIATLQARTSILASANPIESRYNPNISVVENIQLPPTLLSRFDLIYLILDSPNVEHDRRLAQHLVGLYYETPNVVEPPIDQTLLRDYIHYARDNIHPELSDEAANCLLDSYLEMRNPGGGSAAAVGAHGTRTISATPRQLESLVRLSEALAKMRYGTVVTRHDAREAVRLMKVATQAAATDPRTGRIDMDMINTGRSAVDRQQEQEMLLALKELLAERRGNRLSIRDVSQQLGEITNTTPSHDAVVESLRLLDGDGTIQLNERAQTIFVRSGVVH